jgi:glycosyltransferase involved in cell wall biosynthesis
MINSICLSKEYSTTQLLTKDTPILERNSEDKFQTSLFLTDNNKRQFESGLRKQGYFKKSYLNKPLVTIVTVTYNSEQFLEETINSILNQTYNNIEYIIIDGGSTDNTLNILKKYEDQIDYIVSEPDNGMYDALNKGFLVSWGELINFCNSDDVLYSSNTIQKIIDTYILENFDLSYGIAEFIDQNNKTLSYRYNLNFKKRYLVTLGMPFVQPSSFWKKSIMKKVGLFDLNYKIISDYDLISRILLKSNKIYNMPFPIIKFRKHGVSFGDLNTKIAREEGPIIRTKIKNFINMSTIEDTFFSILDRSIQKINQIVKSIKENKSWK